MQWCGLQVTRVLTDCVIWLHGEFFFGGKVCAVKDRERICVIR